MRILLLGPLRSSFVKTDIQELSKAHTVVALDTILGKGLKAGVSLVSLTFRTIVQLLRADVLYCWFADYHTLIPILVARLLRRQAIVIAGGYDVGWLPELGYGARARPLRWFFARNSFRFASLVLPVSEYAQRQLHMLTNGKHAHSVVVYNGILADRFPAEITGAREPLAITVSQGNSITEYVRKGLDRFIAVARLVPTVEFVIIGPTGAALHRAQADALGVENVNVIPGFVSLHDTIIPYFMRASCYCQFSIEETFGMAVVEAMLCGCIPVTTNGGALPEVTGNAGYRGEVDIELAQGVMASINAESDARQEARTYAMRFSSDARGKKLLELFHTIKIARI
ncbi:MAG: glycosyltransferase family 4 protein [bacterium]|nr:glycosyltransferase family 4 protein [bacterium]